MLSCVTLTSVTTVNDEENHEREKKKTEPRKSHFSDEMGNRLPIYRIQREMKYIKSKERNRISDDVLFQLMRIGCTNIDIDIQSIVRQQEKPQVSH